MVRHLFHSFMGIVSSLIGTIVIFIIAGRSLGPSAFGQFSVVYATCSLLGILFDFGYMTRLLKDTQAKMIGDKIILAQEALMIKFLLFAVISFALVGVVFFFNIDPTLTTRFWIGISLISVANFFGSSLRATGRHLLDTRNLFLANLSGAVYALYLALVSATANDFAMVFVVIGFVYVAMTLWAWRSYGAISQTRPKVATVWHEFTACIPYSIDVIAQRGFVFFDVMILSLVASPAVVGIYQAAQKVALATNVFAQPFNNVFIPRFSKVAHQKSAFIKLGNRAIKIQLLVGISSLVGLVLFGPIIVTSLYSEEFSAAGNIMWIFGILIAVRYLAAAQTLQITALNLQRTRTIINISCLIVFAASSYPLGLLWAEKGIIIASILASALICAAAWLVKKRFLHQMQ